DGRLQAVMDRALSRVLASPAAIAVAPVVLGAPLGLTLFLRKGWVYWGGIPAQDVTYIPQLTVLIGFGTAMIVGWLLRRRAALLDLSAKRWVGHLVVALATTAYCSSVAGTKFTFIPPPLDASKALFAASYVVALWSWIFAIIGLAVRYLSS